MKPLITALVDTYNHERYIEQALVSVLDQGLSPSELEIVVVEDGSTDRTPEVVHKFEPRVRLLRKKNGGQASAFNAGFPECRGQFIALLDGDDWWARDKLALAIERLQQDDALLAVGHAYDHVQEDGSYVATVTPKGPCRADLSSVAAARSASRLRHFLGGSMICVRAEVLRRMGPIPDALIFSADAMVFSAALALGSVCVLEQPLCYYRLHSDNFYSFSSQDAARISKRTAVMEALTKAVPSLLARLGVQNRRIRAFVEADELAVESQRFVVAPPGRLRFFRHLLRYIRAQASQMTWKLKAINVVNAFGALVVGYQRFYLLDQWRERLFSSLRRLGHQT